MILGFSYITKRLMFLASYPERIDSFLIELAPTKLVISASIEQDIKIDHLIESLFKYKQDTLEIDYSFNNDDTSRVFYVMRDEKLIEYVIKSFVKLLCDLLLLAHSPSKSQPVLFQFPFYKFISTHQLQKIRAEVNFTTFLNAEDFFTLSPVELNVDEVSEVTLICQNLIAFFKYWHIDLSKYKISGLQYFLSFPTENNSFIYWKKFHSMIYFQNINNLLKKYISEETGKQTAQYDIDKSMRDYCLPTKYISLPLHHEKNGLYINKKRFEWKEGAEKEEQQAKFKEFVKTIIKEEEMANLILRYANRVYFSSLFSGLFTQYYLEKGYSLESSETVVDITWQAGSKLEIQVLHYKNELLATGGDKASHSLGVVRYLIKVELNQFTKQLIYHLEFDFRQVAEKYRKEMIMLMETQLLVKL